MTNKVINVASNLQWGRVARIRGTDPSEFYNFSIYRVIRK